MEALGNRLAYTCLLCNSWPFHLPEGYRHGHYLCCRRCRLRGLIPRLKRIWKLHLQVSLWPGISTPFSHPRLRRKAMNRLLLSSSIPLTTKRSTQSCGLRNSAVSVFEVHADNFQSRKQIINPISSERKMAPQPILSEEFCLVKVYILSYYDLLYSFTKIKSGIFRHFISLGGL